MTLSAIILAKNEEKNITSCIKDLSFCNEIIVIDDESSDQTAKLARKNNATVISHALSNNFSAQRNFALSKARGEWVFFIDADEKVSPLLQKEIVKKISESSSITGYYIKREDFLWGNFLKHGETGNMFLLRLAKKNKGIWHGKVHETWITQGKTAELKNPLYHYPHTSVREFLQEINLYSTIRAQELYDDGVKASWMSILAYPKAKFLQNYVLKMGFLDGTAGLVFALLMSFYSFLVRSKLWLLWGKKSTQE